MALVLGGKGTQWKKFERGKYNEELRKRLRERVGHGLQHRSEATVQKH